MSDKSSDDPLDFIDRLRAGLKALTDASAGPSAEGPDSAAEQARQRASDWLNRHHTPTRRELTMLRAALHAAVLEVEQYRSLALTGAKLCAAVQDTLTAAPAIDDESSWLIGLIAKCRASFTRAEIGIAGQREAVAAALGDTAPKASPVRAGKGHGKAVN